MAPVPISPSKQPGGKGSIPHSVWREKTRRYASLYRLEVIQAVSRCHGKVDELPMKLSADGNGVKSLEAPLLETATARSRQAAMALHQAMSLRAFASYPEDEETWKHYLTFYRMDSWAAPAIWTLILLTVLETPLWCETNFLVDPGGCKAATDEDLLSGIFYLPVSVSVVVEYTILIMLARRFVARAQLFRGMKAHGFHWTRDLALEGMLILLSLVDVTIFTFTACEKDYRAAPFLRFGIAASSLPRLRDLVGSFGRTTLAISKVGMFWAYTVAMFAWVGATVLDDVDDVNKFGVPVNQGFETFGTSLYTAFTTLTTSSIPDSLVPSYTQNRAYALLWVPFIFIGAVLLKQVILAGVYNDYQLHAKQSITTGRDNRYMGINIAFSYLISRDPIMKEGSEVAVVRVEAFEKLIDSISNLIHVQKEILHVIFKALDDDQNGVICSSEFQDMCDVLQFEFAVCRRDSCIRRSFAGTFVERFLLFLMDNGQERARNDSNHLGYDQHFPGSVLDTAMNAFLALNVLWVVFESIIDLNNMIEPAYFGNIDLAFAFIYVLEAALKLSHWSWPEYWHHSDNRFDFITTMVLASVGVACYGISMKLETLRQVNMIRLLRLVKALRHIRMYQRASNVVTKLISTCREVLLLNVMVALLWAAAGVQIFGGKLVESNPNLHGKSLDYFSSNLTVFNFNDVPSGMMTFFVWTLAGWNDSIAEACFEMADPYSAEQAMVSLYLISYYVASPLLAFNIFSAFSIDVYCTLDAQEEMEAEVSEIERNLLHVQAQMAQQGYVLHMQESAELAKLRVHQALFQ